MKTVYLIDTNAFFYRAFFAIKDLRASDGFPTGALFGFTSMIRKVMQEYRPEYIASCFDVSRHTFRTEIYKEYKANRPALDEDLKVQIPYIKQIVQAYGIPILEKASFEADDVIASLAGLALRQKYNVCIVSSDKDIFQLINGDSIVVYDPVKKKTINEQTFVEQYAFPPASMVDFIALTGDAADNIAGVKGIGDKTASTLIRQFITVEHLLKRFSEISSHSIRQKLLENKDRILSNKKLILLRSDVELIDTIEELRPKEPDTKALNTLFRRFEFKKFIDESLRERDAACHSPGPVLNSDSGDLTRRIQRQKEILFIVEDDRVYCRAENEVFETSVAAIKDTLEDPAIQKVTFDCKEALRIITAQGIVLRGVLFDISIACSLVDSSCVKADPQSMFYFFFKEDLPPDLAGRLNGLERLHAFLKKTLREYDLEDLFYRTEIPLIDVLFSMEQSGVKIDRGYLQGLLEEAEGFLKQEQQAIFALAGEEFNLNSPQQVARMFFEKLKMPPRFKTKTGYSTNEEVLRSLAKEHPIAERLLSYRELNKIKSTYIIPFLEEARARDDRIHARFEQSATNTGRLSSHSPNLQNIPARGSWADKIRQAFISSFSDGYLLCADYSQIELRVLAALSRDNNLTRAFMEDKDIHIVTAALVFDKKESAVTDDERDIAKKINFGIVYGISAYGLSKQVSIGPDQAELFIQQYFSRYPGVKQYIDRVIQIAEKDGYVSTLLGRRRSLPQITSSNRQLREFAQRQAVNTPVQGTAAEIIKRAMVRLSETIKNKGLVSRLIIQIHDELVLDVDAREMPIVIQEVRSIMEHALPLDVPLKAVIQRGRSWGQMEEVVV